MEGRRDPGIVGDAGGEGSTARHANAASRQTTGPFTSPVPRRWLLLAVGVASLAVTAATFSPAPHTGGDNAVYVSLATSLVQEGAYREIFDPAGEPHSKYPPVFPLLLSGLLLLGIGSWSGLKLVAAASAIACALLTFLWTERRASPAWAAGAALALVLSPAIIDSSHWILSEATFVALTLLSLWALDRADRDEAASRWLALGIVSAGLAYFTRSAGLPLLVAVMAWLALRRRWRSLAGGAILLGPPIVLWLLRGGQSEYVAEAWLADPYAPALGPADATDLAARALENLAAYSALHLPHGLSGLQGAFSPAMGALLIAAATAGWLLSIRRHRGPTELFAPLYAGLVLLWPTVWAGERLALPLYPLVLGYGAVLLARSTRRSGGLAPVLVGAAALALVAGPAAAAMARTARDASECRELAREHGPFSCYGDRVRAVVDAAGWAGSNLPSGSVVLTRKPPLFFVLSGLPSRRFPLDTDPAAHWALAGTVGARYELLDEWGELAPRYVGGAVRAHPERYCIVRSFGASGRTVLLGLLPEAEWTPGDRRAGSGVRPCPAGYVDGDGRRPHGAFGREIPLLTRLDPERQASDDRGPAAK